MEDRQKEKTEERWDEVGQNRKERKPYPNAGSGLQQDSEDFPPWSTLTPTNQRPGRSNCRACTAGERQDAYVIENGRNQSDPSNNVGDGDTDSTHATSGNEWYGGRGTTGDSNDKQGKTGNRHFLHQGLTLCRGDGYGSETAGYGAGKGEPDGHGTAFDPTAGSWIEGRMRGESEEDLEGPIPKAPLPPPRGPREGRNPPLSRRSVPREGRRSGENVCKKYENCDNFPKHKNHNDSRCNDGSTVAIIANTIISDYRSDESRRQAIEWMRRRCCKEGRGENFFKGVKVERRDLREAKKEIRKSGNTRSDNESSKAERENKREKAGKAENEEKYTGKKGETDAKMEKGKEHARTWEKITQAITERGKGKQEEGKKERGDTEKQTEKGRPKQQQASEERQKDTPITSKQQPKLWTERPSAWST